MSDTKQLTPADLARELIRLDDGHAAKPADIVAFTRLVEHRGLHARTIAEAYLAALDRIKELEAASRGVLAARSVPSPPHPCLLVDCPLCAVDIAMSELVATLAKEVPS